MRMAVRLIRESEERTVRDHARGVLERQTTVLERLVADVLGGLQAQQGTMLLRLEPLDITAVVRGAVETVRQPDGPASASLGGQRPRHRTRAVIADRSRVHQVLSNLLANAARYTPAGGHITVGLVEAADGIDIVVKDTGCGIAAEDLASIFQPFTRGGRPRRDDGLGLGLWLAREIAVAARRNAPRRERRTGDGGPPSVFVCHGGSPVVLVSSPTSPSPQSSSTLARRPCEPHRRRAEPAAAVRE
jgi:signal transduction histidine kinase